MNINTETPASMSFSQRIIETFLSPRAVFEDVSCRPSWLSALVSICIINLGFSLLTISKIQEFMQITMQSQMQTAPGSADYMAIAVKTATISAVAGAALSPVIFCLVAAGLLKLCNMFTGESTPYRQFFAVSVYAYLPMVIASVLGSILVFLTPAANLAEVSTSLYLLFPPGTTGFAAGLARQIDPFYLWTVLLISMGGAAISRGKVKTYAMFMFGLWAILAVASAFLTQMA